MSPPTSAAAAPERRRHQHPYDCEERRVSPLPPMPDDSDDTAPIRISSDRRVNIPLTLIGAMLFAFASVMGIYFTIRHDIASNANAIASFRGAIVDFKTDVGEALREVRTDLGDVKREIGRQAVSLARVEAVVAPNTSGSHRSPSYLRADTTWPPLANPKEEKR